MIIHTPEPANQWNLDNIRFLHPPDDFLGSFTNEKMQARHEAMQEQKIKEITSGLAEESHPAKAMRVLHKKEYVQFVTNNMERFKRADCFEETVLSLYYDKNTPFASAGDFATWKFFFESCDRDRLYSRGLPFPGTSVTAYRGSVTGVRKGFSWTIDKARVAALLKRWEDKEEGGGTVFSLELTRADILVYLKDEKKEEVIVRPSMSPGTAAVEVISL